MIIILLFLFFFLFIVPTTLHEIPDKLIFRISVLIDLFGRKYLLESLKILFFQLCLFYLNIQTFVYHFVIISICRILLMSNFF